jgi:chromosome segregation ATPase
VLYLAEVKKQTRGFIGGLKTELKLLACQHNDQSWSAVPGDEVLICEESSSWGEGALVLITLSHNRQIQGSPEQATPELIRQLQKISRLMEKVKDEQEKIEQWKQSLTYQSQELTRREMEIEARLEQVDQMESEFEYLERQRKELEESWEHLRSAQQRLEEGQIQLGPLANLSPEHASSIQVFIQRLTDDPNRIFSLENSVHLAVESFKSQQTALDTHWQRLDQHKKSLPQRQQEVERLRETLESRQQELESTRASIEQAKSQVQVQEAVLHSKQELLGRLNLNIQTIEDLRETLTRLTRGGDESEIEQKIDLSALEYIPLGELEEMINKLQKELDKLVVFVNDQEEELTFQCQTVDEILAKLQDAHESERWSIEAELAEEQERKGMLDETLVGQRRTLKDRQGVLTQYIRVLRRRRGMFDAEAESSKINLEPIVVQLIEQLQDTLAEKQRQTREIEHLQTNLQQLKEMVEHQWSELEQKAKSIEQQQQQFQEANFELTKLQSQVQIEQEILQPIQDQLSATRQHLESLSHWIH